MAAPLVTILGNLVRAGARTAAGQAARSTARRGGAKLVKRAAGEAAQPVVSGATRHSVLEDTGLTSARDLTRALGQGGADPAVAAGESAPASASVPRARSRVRGPDSLRPRMPEPEPEPAAPEPRPRMQQPRRPGSPRPRTSLSGGGSGSGGGNTTASPAGEPPDNRSTGQTFKEFAKRQLESLRHGIKETFTPPTGKQLRQAMQEKPRSVADETAGMSLDQRYDRLQKSGQAMDWKQVRDQFGIPNPTRKDIIEASEKKEQEAREKQAQEIERSRLKLKDFAFTLAYAGGAVGALTATGMSMVALPRIVEKWSTGLVESQRHLARFDARMAGAFMRLNRGDLLRQQREAAATGGTTAMLADQLNSLRSELAPMRSSMRTLVNTAGTIAVGISRIVVWMIRISPGLQAAIAAAEAVERNTRQKNTTTYTDFLRDIAAGKSPSQPKNRPPEPPKP